MSESHSAAKKTQKRIILINCVFQKKNSVTQCYLLVVVLTRGLYRNIIIWQIVGYLGISGVSLCSDRSNTIIFVEKRVCSKLGVLHTQHLIKSALQDAIRSKKIEATKPDIFYNQIYVQNFRPKTKRIKNYSQYEVHLHIKLTSSVTKDQRKMFSTRLLSP